jgi:hypothetical protein
MFRSVPMIGKTPGYFPRALRLATSGDRSPINVLDLTGTTTYTSMRGKVTWREIGTMSDESMGGMY